MVQEAMVLQKEVCLIETGRMELNFGVLLSVCLSDSISQYRGMNLGRRGR